MTAANYPNCLAITLAYEGGFSNHPADPGGVTLEGIIQRVYDQYRVEHGKPKRPLSPSIRGTTEWINERNEIYRENYWNKIVGDQWPEGTDLAVWDCAVNSGPARSRQFCEALLGKSTIWGPWAAAVRAKPDRTPFIKAFCAKRLAFLHSLKIWATFGSGWGKRVASVEANGVRMALNAMRLTPAEQKKQLEREAADAKAKSAGHGKAAGGTTAGGGVAGGASDWSTHDWLSLGGKIALAAAAVIAVIYFIHWWRAHKARSEAYAAVAAATGG